VARVLEDAFTHYVFIGPYAEWLSRDIVHIPEDEADPDGWGELLDGGALHWNISYASALPPRIMRRAHPTYQYCRMPREDRRGRPRDHMLLILNANQHPQLAVSWVGLDSKREIEWFARAFRKELDKLTRLFGHSPRMDWGLVYMWS
jgi:hypothetical protein